MSNTTKRFGISDSLIEAINQVREEKQWTYKDHAAKARELRAKVEDLTQKRIDATNAAAAAVDELKRHMAATPSKRQQAAAKKQETKNQESWRDYREPGRSRERRTPYEEN